jgi:hypothetical protein
VIDVRRFPRLRAVAVGFALIGFTAALAAAASGPAQATVPAVETSEILPVFYGSLPPSQTVVAVNDTVSYPTPTAHEKEPPGYSPSFEPATVTCTPAPSDVILGTTTTITCTAQDTVDAINTHWNTYKFSLTSLDEPTSVNTPGFPYPTNTADASDTAPVTYTAVTASEGALNVHNEVNEATPGCVPVGPGPTSATSDNAFVSGGTFPVGITTLYCTASDYADGLVFPVPPYAYQKVTVADQPVTLTVPSTQLAQATSSSGATVSYSPLAAEDGEAETVGYCSADKPAASSGDGFVSGGNFPVGGTTLTCYATDLVDGTSTALPTTQSFTVIVTKTPCAALASCNLHGLDLSNAILAGADLSSGTDLSNANLNEADLSGANLSFASLSGANLNKADLTGANLTGAITTGANFNMVTWSNTTCPDGTNSNASTPETCVGHL